MISSGYHSDTNALAAKGTSLQELLARPDIDGLVRATHVDWNEKVLISSPEAVMDSLMAIGGIDGGGVLTGVGLSMLAKLQIDLEAAVRSGPLADRFVIGAVIGEGRTSIALRAANRSVARDVVLKVLRPGSTVADDDTIRRLGVVAGVPHVVAPIDAYEVAAHTISGDAVVIRCVVFPFVSGMTLREFLRSRPPMTPMFFEKFIEHVAGALGGLEELGLEHGDLHNGNILVADDGEGVEFTLIDVSAGLESATSPAGLPDFIAFQSHLQGALIAVQKQLPTLSIPKFLGARLFFLVDAILNSTSLTFRDVRQLRLQNPAYERWTGARAEFLAKKFRTPQPLGLLRWEEIADPAEALDLFEPYPELFDLLRRFGNSLMYGARGSGKSTYLAALAYFPGAKHRKVQPADVFGVLFSCRQGEFKQLSPDYFPFTPMSRLHVKHIIVLKILRRILGILASAADAKELHPSTTLEALYGFFAPFLNDRVSIPPIAGSGLTALSNLAAGVARWEEFEVRRLFGQATAERLDGGTLTELSLLQFCVLLKNEFAVLANTQFYFLFDDAGEPNIPREAQYVLNELLTSSNSVFCVKLSAERFSYFLRDSQQRIIEETHDLTSFDIARAYGSESGFDPSRAEMKDYFARIMRRRLEHWHYPSTDITAYLGDQARRDSMVLPVKQLVRRLADGNRDAYYAGWEVLWQIADRTARNLIELVSEIFAHAKILPSTAAEGGPQTIVGRISAITQDRAIRAVSERRLRSLELTPGVVEINGQSVALGRQLFVCATTFGAVSKQYLKSSRKHTGRTDERLAFERNDSARLGNDADRVLHQLIRYAVFDDSAFNVARDDGLKKPVYVFSRILCPAFGISFRRDAHLRVSHGKFELFLTDPTTFLMRGTAALRQAYALGELESVATWEELDE